MDADGPGTSDEVRNENTYFIVKHLKQIRKFATTGLDYKIQFTDTLADLELWEYHTRLHAEIFQSWLETVQKDVPMNGQVRFVLRSPQQ